MSDVFGNAWRFTIYAYGSSGSHSSRALTNPSMKVSWVYELVLVGNWLKNCECTLWLLSQVAKYRTQFFLLYINR